ncbi:MAG: hypothetical protein ACPF8V_09900 [Luteibaculum sp.]
MNSFYRFMNQKWCRPLSACFLLLLISPIFGQNEAPYLGATWYYDYNYPNGDRGVSKVVLGDTLTIDGKLYYKLNQDEDFCQAIETEYIRYSANGLQIYYWNESDQQEFLFYDFSLKPGEILKIYTNRFPQFSEYRVDSVSETNIFGENKRVLYTTYVRGDYLDFLEYQVEGIGSLYHFIPHDGLCDFPNVYRLRCYQLGDSIKKYVDHGCEDYIVGISEPRNIQPDWSLWSQNQQLTVNFSESVTGTLAITDLSGKELLATEVIRDQTLELEIPGLSPGIYVASFRFKSFEGCTRTRFMHLP